MNASNNIPLEPTQANEVTIVDGLLGLPPRSSELLSNKTVLTEPGLRVVLLSFPSGYVMREHKTPKTLLIQALDGRFRIGILGNDTILKPGKLIKLSPNVPHDVEALEAGRLQLTVLG